MARILDAQLPPQPGWRALGKQFACSTCVPEECASALALVQQSRIRLFAPVLALLTVAWIPFDLLWLGPRADGLSILLRVLVAAALLALSRADAKLSPWAQANLFLWVQAVGFGLLQWRLDPTRNAALEIGYGLFPFILAAQIAVLPLPWPRAALLAVAPALQLAATFAVAVAPAPALWSDLWLFTLIALLSLWTSHAQMHLLCDLRDARMDAAHDPLTGLANRRAAAERLEAERMRAVRTGDPLSVLMIDLDHFKQVNDLWGHADGDRVLVAIARVLRQQLRGVDLAARHGGEEFLALLPGTDAAQALEAAERIRHHIERLRIALSGEATVGITASIGLATLQDGEGAESLLARADAALYAAKAAGRNRSAAAPSSRPVEKTPGTQ